MSISRKLKSPIPKGTFIRCFGDLNNKTVVSDSYSNTCSTRNKGKSLTLIEGELISYQADHRFLLHGGHTKELMDFQVVTIAKKSLCITILLEGKLDFGYDDLNFSFDANQKKAAVVVNLARPVSFRRTLFKNNNVSKLNIILPFGWVENCTSDSDNMSLFMAQHLANLELNLNEDMLVLTTDIIKRSNSLDFIEKMQVEALTQLLLLEVFKQLNDVVYSAEKQKEPIGLSDPILDKLIAYIENHLAQDISVAHLADFAAMSLSSLQLKFKKTLGTSVQSYIRRRRLTIAKQQLEQGMITITEAAYNAGYRHPSNFTSAFKKTFGFPPQNIKIQDLPS